MQDNTYRTIKNAIWGTAVAVSIGISAYSGFDYLKARDTNYPQRVQADVQRIEAMQTLLQNPEYKEYLQQRKEFTKELVDAKDRVRNIEVLERIVDAAFGDIGNQK